ncbi:MAG TPA: hypothetical protein VK168_01855 [Saprospiraceae bacterium]|nr:hypothetical protein [Saprospiraceae bacterium]
MQKLIRNIFGGHRLYIMLILLLSSCILYQEYYNQKPKLKEVLSQDLQAVGTVFHIHYKRLHEEIMQSFENYPSQYSEHYCNRLLHLDQQSDSLRQWVTNGLAGKHKPYFPALKEAYNNQLDLAKIYCEKESEVLKSFSAFNPDISPPQKFSDSLFLTHLQLATMINQLVSANYFAQRVLGTDSNCWGPFDIYPAFNYLNFRKDNRIQFDIILGFYGPYLDDHSINYHLFLNNQEFPIKNGIAPFHYQFDTPGIHPLQVRWQYNHPETDSVTVFEKIYYVKVDPS